MEDETDTLTITLPVAIESSDGGYTHDLEYYDGPLLSAQMRIASSGARVVEVIVDRRLAQTDGEAIFFRLSKNDLEKMLRIVDEDQIAGTAMCGRSPDGDRSHCPSCDPTPNREDSDASP